VSLMQESEYSSKGRGPAEWGDLRDPWAPHHSQGTSMCHVIQRPPLTSSVPSSESALCPTKVSFHLSSPGPFALRAGSDH
jgi:hypothetical protein